MQFTFNHTNLNVADLEKSIRFYEEALGLKVQRMVAPESGDFKLAFLEDGVGCVCFENEAMGLYFIEDPDGYWFEITPVR